MINYTIFVGLDVYKDSITVAMARSGFVFARKCLKPAAFGLCASCLLAIGGFVESPFSENT